MLIKNAKIPWFSDINSDQQVPYQGQTYQGDILSEGPEFFHISI